MHTFSISRVISKNDADKIYNHITDWTVINSSYCVTYSFTELGISKLMLWRIIKDSLMIHMLEMTVNPNKLFGGNGYSSTLITDINEVVMQQTLQVIDHILPELDNYNEELKELQNELEYLQIHVGSIYDQTQLSNKILIMKHPFKLRRIDFSFDISTEYKSEYIRLINMGFPMSGRRMKHQYYDSIEKTAEYDELEKYENLDDDPEQYDEQSSYSSAYWKGKSVNINIYDKYEEMKRKNAPEIETEEMRDLLRIEVQIKVNKLRNIVRNSSDIDNRELLKLATLDMERKLLLEYLNSVVRKGYYMKLALARKIIRSSNYKKSKQDKLIELLKEISKCGGIEAFLQKVDNGYKKLGELSTIKTYLRNLQDMDINPVLIPDDMKTEQDILHSISDIVQAYYDILTNEINEYHSLDSGKTKI